MSYQNNSYYNNYNKYRTIVNSIFSNSNLVTKCTNSVLSQANMFSDMCPNCLSCLSAIRTNGSMINTYSPFNYSNSSVKQSLSTCHCFRLRSQPSYSSRKHRSFLDLGWGPCLHLILGLLLLIPTTMSSPLRMHETDSSSSTGNGEHIRHQRPAKWINPCRIPVSAASQSTHFDVQQQSDADMFQNILSQVSKAEHQARNFMENFFEESFGTKLQKDKYKDIHQDWIGNVAESIGKYLGEQVDPAKLEALTVEDTLRTMYEGLQKFAVGLEQVVLDQAVYGGNFHQHFNEAEFQLKYVLCELQIAMLEKSIPHEDITREIMSQTYRDLDDRTTRNVRDWLILRDYVNVLEYLKQTFMYFQNKAKNP